MRTLILSFSLLFCLPSFGDPQLPKNLTVEELLTTKTVEFNIYGSKKPNLTIVFFWASWCEFCKELGEELWKIQARNPTLFEVIGISADEEKKNAVRPAGSNYRFISRHYWLPKANFKTFNLSRLPAVVLVTKDGKLDTVYLGSESDKVSYFKKRLFYLGNSATSDLDRI